MTEYSCKSLLLVEIEGYEIGFMYEGWLVDRVRSMAWWRGRMLRVNKREEIMASKTWNTVRYRIDVSRIASLKNNGLTDYILSKIEKRFNIDMAPCIP